MKVSPTPCSVCGRPWWRWEKSNLPCHARCFFPPEVQDDIYALRVMFPRASVERIARDFGVSSGVIRAAIFEGAKRAGRTVSAWGR